MEIRMNQKIGVGAAVVVGAVTVVGTVAKAVSCYGRKRFYEGLDVGKLISDFTTAEKFTKDQAEMHRKYEKLKEKYEELSADYSDMRDFYEGE